MAAPASEGDVISGHSSKQGIRPSMEDEVLILPNEVLDGGSVEGPVSIYAVFDGHGGHAAARYVRDNLRTILIEELKLAQPEDALKSAFERVDTAFLAACPDGSGTTACVLLRDKASKQLWVANAGDSRAVLCGREGVVPLSSDHKADRADEVARIRKAGGFVIHKRVMGELAVSRAIGDMSFKQESALVIATPEVVSRKQEEGDEFVVLACDGLFDVMSNDAVCNFVRAQFQKARSPEQAAEALADHALSQLGTRDNVSIVVVQLTLPKQGNVVDAACDELPVQQVEGAGVDGVGAGLAGAHL
jgi:serine/threonine protein phosphatase PrpC